MGRWCSDIYKIYCTFSAGLMAGVSQLMENSNVAVPSQAALATSNWQSRHLQRHLQGGFGSDQVIWGQMFRWISMPSVYTAIWAEPLLVRCLVQWRPFLQNPSRRGYVRQRQYGLALALLHAIPKRAQVRLGGSCIWAVSPHGGESGGPLSLSPGGGYTGRRFDMAGIRKREVPHPNSILISFDS